MNKQQLKNSILQWAIQGKLVPQIASEGTAEDLLKEIRAEKEKLVKEGKLKKKDLEVKPIEEDEIPFEIPEGWRWCRLGELASFVVDCPHSTPQKSSCITNHPCIRTSEIKGGVIVWDSMQYLDEANYKLRISRLKPQEGDIVYAREGVYGDAVILPSTHEFCLGQRTMMLRMALRSITEYIHKAIISPFGYSQAVKLNREGTTSVGHVNMSDIVNFLFPLPPLSEQKRIVSKIEELMPLVEQYGKAQERLNVLNKELPEKLKKSVLQEAIMGKLVPQDPNEGTADELLAEIRKEKERLVKEGKLKKKDLEVKPIEEDEMPFEVPSSWKWVRLGEISTYALTKKKINASDADPKIWGLDLEDIEKGGRLLCQKTVGERGAIGDKTIFSSGDILYSKLRPYLLKILIAPQKGICTSEIVPFSCYGSIDAHYMVNFLKSPFVDDYINSTTFGIKMPRVSTETMTSLLVPLPPLSEQTRIVEKIEDIFAKIDS